MATKPKAILNPTGALRSCGPPECLSFRFGAYGETWLVVFGMSLEDGLEECASWLAEHEPGHLSTEQELADAGCYNEKTGEMVDHTYTESGYLASWEWTVDDAEASDYIDSALVSMLEDGTLDAPYFDRFDICEAWHLWLSLNHGGQGSTEYARLSRLGEHFSPGMAAQYPWSLDFNAAAIYAQLVQAHRAE